MTAMTATNYAAEERTLIKAERAAKDESTETTTETAEAETQTTEESTTSGSSSAQNLPERPDQNMDMSSLTLPEGFKPFDEAHKPDGTMAPANGEIKPIEFDANGNMTYGQPPQMGQNGQAPSFNGQQPPQMGQNGQAPSLNGQQPPQMPGNGQAPSTDGQAPQFSLPSDGLNADGTTTDGTTTDGQTSGNTNQAPSFNGQQPPQMPGNGQAPSFNGQQPPQMNGNNGPSLDNQTGSQQNSDSSIA